MLSEDTDIGWYNMRIWNQTDDHPDHFASGHHAEATPLIYNLDQLFTLTPVAPATAEWDMFKFYVPSGVSDTIQVTITGGTPTTCLYYGGAAGSAPLSRVCAGGSLSWGPTTESGWWYVAVNGGSASNLYVRYSLLGGERDFDYTIEHAWGTTIGSRIADFNDTDDYFFYLNDGEGVTAHLRRASGNCDSTIEVWAPDGTAGYCGYSSPSDCYSEDLLDPPGPVDRGMMYDDDTAPGTFGDDSLHIVAPVSGTYRIRVGDRRKLDDLLWPGGDPGTPVSCGYRLSIADKDLTYGVLPSL